jgi:glycosyltransferase involved in cell wall biosynthesis
LEELMKMLGDKRIAIVCAHFTPEVGYQEEALARSFARLGAMVLVLTSTELSANARTLLRAEYRQGVQKVDGYTIVRAPTLARLGANVVGRKVKASIRAFSPDYVILVGPGKLFGLELFSGKPRTWRRIVVIQDNSEDGRSRARERWSGPFTEVLHRVLKRPAYRQVVRNADRIILNVPETRRLIEPWLRTPERQQLRRKGVELSLGFDPERFFFDPAIRGEWRTRHGLEENELVVATCTRATPSKRLEDVIDTISTLRRSGVRLRYVLAGLLGDRYAETLRKHVAAQSDPSAFVLLPTLRHDEMRALFCASDLGFWPQAAITIQQAMGTGLPVVLRRRPTVSHLLTPGTNGWFVETEETLMEALSRATKTLSDLLPEERLARRTDTACFNSLHLSYDVIALKMLDGFLGD